MCRRFEPAPDHFGWKGFWPILASNQVTANKATSRNNLFSFAWAFANWPSLVFASLSGLVIAGTFLASRFQSRRNDSRAIQQSIAQSDLKAINALLQFPSSKAVEDAIATLTNGELLRIENNALPGEEFVADHYQYSWSEEPNGYVRLRVTSPVDGQHGTYRQLALIRRFSVREIQTLTWTDWLTAGSLVFIFLGTGVWFAHVKWRHLHLISFLDAWSRNCDSRVFPLSMTESSVGLESLEPAVSKIITQISASMQDRLVTIQQSVEQSTRVMSAMPVGVLAFDESLNLIFVNRAGRELLGILDSTHYGRPLIEVIRQPTVVNLIQEVSQQPITQQVELELPLSKTILRLMAHPLSDSTASIDLPNPNGVLLTITDETRLKQLENARRDFTANVSHELKTPLSAIKAYAETLLIGALEDEEAARRFVERISEQANRLDVLIRDLLHLTRLQSQPESPTLSELQLDDVLATCVEEHRTLGLPKNVNIDVSGVEKECVVKADLESLRTVIGNLLGNAVRYNRHGGWVHVSTRIEGDFVILIVADNGIGIPPEDLDRIFERFYRVEKARSQDSGGTGLGLAIVKHLVQAMSAEIRVSSVLDQGSTFELRLLRGSKP